MAAVCNLHHGQLRKHLATKTAGTAKDLSFKCHSRCDYFDAHIFGDDVLTLLSSNIGRPHCVETVESVH